MSKASQLVTLPNLGGLRTRLRINASELARLSGVSRSSVHKAERGDRIELIIGLRIADCLDQVAQELGHGTASEIRSELKQFTDFALEQTISNRENSNSSEPKQMQALKDSLDEFFERGYLQYLDIQQRRDLAVHLEEFADRLRRTTSSDWDRRSW